MPHLLADETGLGAVRRADRPGKAAEQIYLGHIHADDRLEELGPVHVRRLLDRPVEQGVAAGTVHSATCVIGSPLVQRVPPEHLRTTQVDVAMGHVREEVHHVVRPVALGGEEVLVVVARKRLREVI